MFYSVLLIILLINTYTIFAGREPDKRKGCISSKDKPCTVNGCCKDNFLECNPDKNRCVDRNPELGDKCERKTRKNSKEKIHQCYGGTNYNATCYEFFYDGNKKRSIDDNRCVIENRCVKKDGTCIIGKDPVCCKKFICKNKEGEFKCLPKKGDEIEPEDENCRSIGHRCKKENGGKNNCCKGLHCCESFPYMMGTSPGKFCIDKDCKDAFKAKTTYL